MSNLRWTIRWHLKQRRPRPDRNSPIDRALWTATGITLGAGLAVIATFILFADAYL